MLHNYWKSKMFLQNNEHIDRLRLTIILSLEMGRNMMMLEDWNTQDTSQGPLSDTKMENAVEVTTFLAYSRRRGGGSIAKIYLHEIHA